MNTRLNTSWINETNTYIYVQPQDKRDHEIGFNYSKLDFKWVVDSYRNDVLGFNLTFANPLEISPNIELDKLIIIFEES